MESDVTSVLSKIIKLEYIIDYCRVCMCRRVEDMISLFDSQDDNFIDRIQFCTGLEFKKEDGLPTHICNNCTQNLTVAHKFKTSCLESDNLFRKILQGCKDEPEDLNDFFDNYDDNDHDGHTEFNNISNENVSKSMELKDEVENIRKSMDYEDEVLEKVSDENTRKTKKISNENTRKYFRFDFEDGALENVSNENVRNSIDFEDEALENVSNENVRRSIDFEDGALENVSNENVRRSIDFEDGALENVSNENVRRSIDFEDGALENVSNENVRNSIDFEDEALENVSNENVRRSIDFEDEALENVANENVRRSIDFEDEALENVSNENVRNSIDFEDEALENISNENVRKSMGFEAEVLKKVSNENVRITRTRARVKKKNDSMVVNQIEKITEIKIQEEKERPKFTQGNKKITVDKEKKIEKKERPKIMLGPHEKSKPMKIKSSNLNRLQCEPCNLKFKSKAESSKHQKVAHKNERIICEVCGKVFTTKPILKVHMFTHQPAKFECDHCDYRACKKKEMVSHMRIHGGVKRFKCKLCSRSYHLKSHLKSHIRDYHEDVRKFQCDICDKRFHIRSKLDRHIQTHEEKRHECEVCHRRFLTRYYWRRHLKQHHGVEVPHLPLRGINRKQALSDDTNAITKSAEGEKRYQCELCPRSYTTFSHLNCHILSCHEAGKKPQCKICNKQFDHKYKLKTHMDIHDENKRIECEICHNTFSRRAFWRLHLQRQHGIKASAPRCGLKISPREEMALLLSNNTGAIAKAHAKQTLATEN